MPIKNQAHEATFFIWNHYSNGPQTSDTPVCKLRTVTGATPTVATITLAASASHDSSGFWTVAVSAAENNVDSATLMVDPSTSYCSADPVLWHNELVSSSSINSAISTNSLKLDTIDNFLDTEVAAILTDTGTTIPATLTAINTAAAANNTLLIAIDNIVDAILVDTGTTLEGKIDVIDGIVDNILVDTAVLGATPIAANVTQIAGSASAATSLSSGSAAVETGAVHNSTAPTASVFLSDTGALSSVDDVYNNRLLLITSGTIAGAVGEIADYTGSTKTFTFTSALPAAPANDVTFMII